MRGLDEPRTSTLTLLAGSAHPALAEGVGRELGARVATSRCERFPDGELHVMVDPDGVDGRDVLVLQPTSAPVNERLVELVLLADASRRAGAASVSAVIPYFGYARHDRRKRPGEPLGVRVVADLLASARLDRIVALDLHSDAVEAALATPLEHATAVPLLARALAGRAPKSGVVVAPDLGAVKRARDVALHLDMPVAVVHKLRRSGTDVWAERVTGDVRGRTPVIVDDMISTGGTIVTAVRALSAEGAEPGVLVAATHGVLVSGALERLRSAGVRELIVTDSIARPTTDPFVTTLSVAPLLAEAVARGAHAIR